MSQECSECGREFDSERGLSIHISQMHDGKEEETPGKGNREVEDDSGEDVRENRGFSRQTVRLTARQFGGITFATGLFLGLALGIMMGGSTSAGIPLQVENTGSPSPAQNQGAPSDTGGGSQVVELESGNYPYKGIEAGIGTGNVTLNGKTFNLKGEPYIGSPDAEITAVSFEDFECPFCKRYNQNAFPKIKSNYIQSGQVQYFFKNLPLPQLHPWAEPAALASECALNQEVKAFWTFKQGFFNNQEALGNAYRTGNFDKSMYRWAEQTGLDIRQFKQCYNNKQEMQEVKEDARQAGDVGAQATPTIFINGKKIEGAQPYSNFRKAIENALN